MLLRKFLRLSTALKTPTLLSQRTCAYHLSQIENINDENKSQKHADDLLNELNTSFPSKILQVLKFNKNNFEGVHILSTLKTFLKIYKNKIGKEIKTLLDLKKEPFFEEICALIALNINKLSASEAVEILEILSRLKVTNEILFPIVKLILNHISTSVNDLSFDEICKLSSLMRAMPETSLKTNLNKVLTHRFVIKLSIDFKENDIKHLDNAISFISSNIQNKKLTETLLNKLNNYSGEIPIRNAIQILESIYAMSYCPKEYAGDNSIKYYPKEWMHVLHKIQNHIIENIDELNAHQAVYITRILSKKLILEKIIGDEFYDSVFIDKIIQKIIALDVGLEDSLSVVKNLRYIRHLNCEILNYACASYFERKTLTEVGIEKEISKLLTLVDGLAMANHKSIFWEEIENHILTSNEILEHDYETLCIFALNLVILGCYPKKIFEKIFSDNFLPKDKKFLIWTFRKLYQKLKLSPTYDGPMPTQTQMDLLRNIHNVNILKVQADINDDLHRYLSEGLGDELYIKRNVTSKLFHNIDFVLVFNQDGYPVPINDTSSLSTKKEQYLEDIIVPPKCKLVTFSSLPSHWFFRNNESKLLGLYEVNISTLEEMGCLAVVLNFAEWKNTPEDKRLSLVMNKIRSRLDINKINVITEVRYV